MPSIQTLERTLFERIRRGIVAAGKLPDMRSFTGTPEQRQTDYEAAKTTMRASTELIEVFGVGAAQSRQELATNKICIYPRSERRGSFVTAGVTTVEPNGSGGFTRFQLPDTSLDFEYEVRIISKNTEYYRIMSDIIREAFGTMREIPLIDSNGDDTADYIKITNLGRSNVTSTTVMEYMYVFQISDFWEDPVELPGVIPPLLTPNIGIILMSPGGGV